MHLRAFVSVHMLFPLPGLPSSSHPPNESPLIVQALPAQCGFPWSAQAFKPLMTLHGINRAMLAHLWFKHIPLTPPMALHYFACVSLIFSILWVPGWQKLCFIHLWTLNKCTGVMIFFFSPLLNNSSDYRKQTLKGIVSLRWGKKSPWLPTSKIHENMTKKKEMLSNKLRLS